MKRSVKITELRLAKSCEEILRRLIAKHHFLQPQNPSFDVWGNLDAREVVADLIVAINSDDSIQQAHYSQDWGK